MRSVLLTKDNITVSITLPKNLYRFVQERADYFGNISAAIRESIRRHIDEKEGTRLLPKWFKGGFRNKW